MRDIESTSTTAKWLLSALLLFGSSSTLAADIYQNGLLTIPSITIGAATFSNMIVTVGSIVSGPHGTAPLGSADSYDPTTNQLVVPVVTVGSSTYYNVVISVGDLISIGSVTGADSYDGTQLTISNILEDGIAYSNVVVTVEAVIGVVGGMPIFSQDEYDTASKQLVIPAVVAAGKIYTNVLVEVGEFVSAGSGSTAPAITQILPNKAPASSPGALLTVNGSGFVPSSVVKWNGIPLVTTYVSPGQLTALISKSDLSAPFTAPIVVSNAATGGPKSNYKYFVVAARPVPTIASLSPVSQILGDPDFTLTIFGAGFSSESVIEWNGTPRATAYLSPTQLSASIGTADLGVAGAVPVSVVDPASRNAPSNVLMFTVSPPPTPTLARISPVSVTVGSQGFTLVALGTGFGPTSVVEWNGSPLPTTLVSATALTATVTGTQVSALGQADVSVVNAGIASNLATLAITSPSVDSVSFQMNPGHTGAVTFRTVHAPTLAWSVDVGGQASYAIIADGAVFITVSRPADYILLALDAATGATRWGPIALPRPASAAYDAGILFVVGADGVMQGIDPSTGNPLWTTALAGQSGFALPPTAANGMVFAAGSGVGGTLYAVDGATGAVAWTQRFFNGLTGTSAVTADGVYVTLDCQTSDFLPALGLPVWTNNTSTSCSGAGATPVVSDGVLYSPNSTNISYQGMTFNAENGIPIATFSADNPPALTATSGFFLQKGTLRGMTLATNTINWSFAGDGSLNTSPIVINGYVVIGSLSGNVYAVDGATGHLAWTQNVGSTISPVNQSGAGFPLPGLAAGDGLLVVPGATTVTAYAISDNP
jgi:outer membrane protein assembly factor BamB